MPVHRHGAIMISRNTFAQTCAHIPAFFVRRLTKCVASARAFCADVAVAVVMSVFVASTVGAQASSSVGIAGTPASHEFGRIRGTVFDSLLMRPVSRAQVELVGTTQTTVADDKGNFAFDNVATGAQTVSFSSALFDSLGLGTLGATVSVTANETAHVTIAPPSLRTMWTYRCPVESRVGSDSGIVWGTIRDAANDSALTAGIAAFSWYDLKPGVLNFAQTVRDVGVNDRGMYFACGLPTEISIATTAASASAASGRVEYSVGVRRLQQMNFLVSSDMVIPDSASVTTGADSSAVNRARGSALLRGTVRDDKKQPLADAIVMLTSADTSVRTDAQGKFQLSNLPSGTHMVQVRRVGSAPVSQLVQLRPNVMADVAIEVSSTNTLATVNVRAKSAQRLAFEKRREENFGYAVDSTLLNNRADLVSVFTNAPFTIVKRKGSGMSISVRDLFRGHCDPKPYLDGLPTQIDLVTVLPPDYFRAIEVLVGKPIPDPYNPGNTCGVILFWSKNIKW